MKLRRFKCEVSGRNDGEGPEYRIRPEHQSRHRGPVPYGSMRPAAARFRFA